jgi:hypothetical protein
MPVDNRSAEGYGGSRACNLPALSGLLKNENDTHSNQPSAGLVVMSNLTFPQHHELRLSASITPRDRGALQSSERGYLYWCDGGVVEPGEQRASRDVAQDARLDNTPQSQPTAK